MQRTPYTYLITHKPSGRKYYGARYAMGCDPSDLWTTYFTSSKVIHKLIERDGPSAFATEIRKTFLTKEAALLWERKIITKLKLVSNPMWFNQHNGMGRPNKREGAKLSLETRSRMSASKKGKPSNFTGKKTTPTHLAARAASRLATITAPDYIHPLTNRLPHNASAITIDGVEYASMSAAAEALNTSLHQIRKKKRA